MKFENSFEPAIVEAYQMTQIVIVNRFHSLSNSFKVGKDCYV